MATPGQQIEQLIVQRYATAEDVNKYAAVLGALQALASHKSGAPQDYLTLLRRLQIEVAVELSRLEAVSSARES